MHWFAPEENVLVVEALLRKTDAQLLPIENHRNTAYRAYALVRKSLSSQLQQSRRILPNGIWDGFYLAHH